MPWTYDDPPAVALNWTEAEQRRCVDAANAVLRDGGDDEQAIYACIAAAGKEEDGMGKQLRTKEFRGHMELKADGEPGEFSAVFATLNVIDHDGDVTLPGAFGEQRVLIEPWNHDYQRPPVGKGLIHEDAEKAVVDGRFFLDTANGKEHHAVVKETADMQEWSYTFHVVEGEAGQFEGEPVYFLKKLDVIGVSPVTRGAGIGTHTQSVKRAKDAESDQGADDTPDGDEGQGGGDPVEPSGPPPEVVRTQIDLDLLEV